MYDVMSTTWYRLHRTRSVTSEMCKQRAIYNAHTAAFTGLWWCRLSFWMSKTIIACSNVCRSNEWWHFWQRTWKTCTTFWPLYDFSFRCSICDKWSCDWSKLLTCILATKFMTNSYRVLQHHNHWTSFFPQHRGAWCRIRFTTRRLISLCMSSQETEIIRLQGFLPLQHGGTIGFNRVRRTGGSTMRFFTRRSCRKNSNSLTWKRERQRLDRILCFLLSWILGEFFFLMVTCR